MDLFPGLKTPQIRKTNKIKSVNWAKDYNTHKSNAFATTRRVGERAEGLQHNKQ